MLLALMIALPLLGSVLPIFGARGGRGLTIGSALIAPILALGMLSWEATRAFSQEWAAFSQNSPAFHVEWIPSIGLDVSLRMDGLGFLFSLLILGIGTLVLIYAYFYMGEKEKSGRLYSFLLLFMGSMMGVVLADNLLLLILFWELTSISSFLLISYNGELSGARKGARMALTVTGAGGLALLAGVLLIHSVVGTFDLQTILTSGEKLKNDGLYPIIVGLVLLGAFTKSAQFPFHFWLPHAMSAPTPVSAYLHSATMVKAGVFLLARLHPALAETELWAWLVVSAGLITLLMGALFAMVQTDLKGILAYSTISHLGLITVLLGLPTPEANIAALFHIINHAAFKAGLFMIVGVIDHETGTRDIRRLSGMRQYLPHTFILTVIASLAMAGVPFFSGFLSKEMFFAEAVSQQTFGGWSWIVPALSTIAALLSVAYSLRLIVDVFLGPPPKHLPNHAPHEPPVGMLMPIGILASLCVVIGILPMPVVSALLNAASFASLGMDPPSVDISIWHGFNLPLQMSIVALVGGWFLHRHQRKLFSWSKALEDIDGKLIFERAIQHIVSGATTVTSHLENGTFQRYAAWMISLVAAVTISAFFMTETSFLELKPTRIDPFTGIAFIVLAIGAAATVWAHKVRLQGLLTLGVSGLMVALIFARFGAPDLALTQIAVEVVTLAFIMLALYFIPYQTIPETNKAKKAVRVAVSIIAGSVVALITWLTLIPPYPELPVSEFYIANSVPGGGGKNVVNVILVDFRAMDTMGEITVITIASLGVVAMLHNMQLFQPTCDPQGRNWAHARHTLILETLSRVALPLILIVAAFIFMRGHNQPGGGFIAGLITASGLLFQYIGSGSGWVESRFKPPYAAIAGIGIAMAGLTGVASLFFGYPFLTTAHTHFENPLLGHVELASALIFDLGVYLTVVGSSMLSLTTLGKLNLVGQKDTEDAA